MLRLFSALAICTGLTLCAATPPTQASDPPKIPVKVEGTFIFKLNVKVGHKYFAKPAAPWYTYFPYDPNMGGTGAGYPNWPQTWPPTDAGKGTMEKMGYAQPTSYFQPPAYWYR